MKTMYLNNKGKDTIFNYLKNDINVNSTLDVISMNYSIYALHQFKKAFKNNKNTNIIISNPNWNKLKILGERYEREYRNKLNQRYIALEIKNILKDNIDIFISKDIGIMNNGIIKIENESTISTIMGNIKFTLDGLGIVPTKDFYLNTYMNHSKDENNNIVEYIDSIKDNRLHNIKNEFISILDELIEAKSPEYIYFIALYSIFTEELAGLKDGVFKKQTGIEQTKIWNTLYKFQEDGARGIIEKLEKYNGCILADSVGLGKTFTALSVIKYYELRNDRVLVLAPKKLRENWTIYTLNDDRNPFVNDRFNYDVLNHTDLSRYTGYSGDINLENINWGNYDLIVIDESHNFRNNNTRKEKVTRYSRMMEEVIKAGVKSKVLMLSATPVNTKMNDLKNQIAFITEEDDSAFKSAGIKSIEQTLRIAQAKFNIWSELPDEARTTYRFISEVNNDYFKLLDAITIARSRKHIEKYYGLDEIGKFPERLKPKNIYSDIDLKGEYPRLEDINKIIKKLNFAIYSPLKYVLPSKRDVYSKKYDTEVKDGKSIFKQTDREQNIIGLMRVNMLKRMESSIHSFGITLANILKKIDYMIDKIENSQNEKIREVEIDEELDDEDLDMVTVGEKIEINLKDMDLKKWKSELEDDKRELEKILKATAVIRPERDEKLYELKKLIEYKIENPINKANKKVIIFTAFADTADYLYENLAQEFKDIYNINSALIKGSGQNKTTMKDVNTKDINTVLTHFSPISKERKKGFTEEIDILIATDCISEGQNLQDCDYLINYDIHWNPVRIIQRFGRIDRIGSNNDVIQLVNFWPNMELDEYINLENRVKSRMVLSDVSSTGEENVLDLSKKEMNDLKYRQKQLLKLKTEVVDLEDISGGISITDLTFNDFKMDLEKYLDKYEEEFFTGLYAIAKIPENLKDEYDKGVIFVLKQVDEDIKAENYNPFHPYYLIYITDEEEIKYSYTHTKNILDILKKIGKENIEVDMEWENRLKKETKNYKNMDKYRRLLEKAIENILGEKEEDGIMSLFRPGGTSIGIENKDIDSFETISYLILE